MFDPEQLPRLRDAVQTRTSADHKIFQEIVDDLRSIASEVRHIRPRTTTAVSLVASDGGNNKLAFDPFFIQLVRVVDSYGKELCLDAVSPTTDLDELSRRQFDASGKPSTALGQLIADLSLSPPTLRALSHMIPTTETAPEKPSWLQVYRDLCEWAALYERICHRTFATNTLLVRDGLLRSKLFRGENFIEIRRKIERAIERIAREDRRDVFLVGIAKHSKVLARYSLAIAIENLFPPGQPCYVRVPRELEAKVYKWDEWAKGRESEEGEGEAPKFTAGDMYFVRFGTRSGDPIWSIDVFSSQTDKVSEVFAYLLADAIEGFPVPFYPRCLQQAHEHAEIVDFDLEILQGYMMSAIRNLIPSEKRGVIDAIRLGTDAAARRYE